MEIYSGFNSYQKVVKLFFILNYFVIGESLLDQENIINIQNNF